MGDGSEEITLFKEYATSDHTAGPELAEMTTPVSLWSALEQCPGGHSVLSPRGTAALLPSRLEKAEGGSRGGWTRTPRPIPDARLVLHNA